MMFVERVEVPVTEGQEEAFAKAMSEKGLKILAAAAGCASARLGRGVESPSKFLLLLEWDAVESHIAFTKTEEFGEFVAVARPFFAGPTSMEHFAML